MKRVGILRGGIGDTYASSLKKGGEILLHINENLADKYKTFDILIDRDGAWHLNGRPIDPSDLMHRVDVVWNTSHANLGYIMESFSIPHISTGAFSSTLSTSREMLREHMKKLGIDMPRHIVIPMYQKDFDGSPERYAIKKAKAVHEKFGAPWIVKSFTPDSSMGIHLAKTFDELVGAISDGVKHGQSILIEEFIPGKVAALHSVRNFRNEKIYTFPLGTTFGKFTLEEKEKLNNLVKYLHLHAGASHYLKSDVVLHSRGKIYLLGIAETPNLKSGSHFIEACELSGVKPHHVIEHILGQVFG